MILLTDAAAAIPIPVPAFCCCAWVDGGVLPSADVEVPAVGSLVEGAVPPPAGFGLSFDGVALAIAPATVKV